MITTRLEPYKTSYSKPRACCGMLLWADSTDLSKLVIQNLIKPYIQNQVTGVFGVHKGVVFRTVLKRT